jgi:drug/metabolite transporter (DMT)-like permease
MADFLSFCPFGRSKGKQRTICRGHLLMVVATSLVATSFPVGAKIAGQMDSLVLTLLRFSLAAALFAPFVMWKFGLSLPTLKDFLRYSLLSGFLVGFFVAMFAALRHTSALNTAAIFSLLPIITTVVSAVLLGETIQRATKLALPLGVLGVLIVLFRGDPSRILDLQLGTGDVIFLLGTISLGIYAPLVKRLHKGEPMVKMTFWTLVTGSGWLLAVSAPVLARQNWASMPIEVYGGIVYLAVFTTLITFFVFQWSSAVIGPTRVMSYTYLNPVFVLAISAVAGQGLPEWTVLPGIALVVFATISVQYFGGAEGVDRPARKTNSTQTRTGFRFASKTSSGDAHA